MLTIKILEIILRNTLINFNRLKQIPACSSTLASVFLKKKPNAKLQNDTRRIEKKISLFKGKIKSLEERYVEDEIEKELYIKYKSKYELEIKAIEQDLSKSQLSSSNLEIAVKKGITISKKASQLWVLSDYSDKQRLQYLIYPDGILYNKENNTLRTPRVNSLFTAISCLSYILAKNKNGQPSQIDQNSRLVVSPRIELGSKV